MLVWRQSWLQTGTMSTLNKKSMLKNARILTWHFFLLDVEAFGVWGKKADRVFCFIYIKKCAVVEVDLRLSESNVS